MIENIVYDEYIHNSKKKIFFIISNQSALDSQIEYSIIDNYGLSNLNRLCYGIMEKNKEIFTVSIYYIDIIPGYLEQIHKDSELEKYEAKIKCKKNKIIGSDIFYGTISFIKTKNNFIYDFEFKESKGLFNKIIYPAPYIKFSKASQLQIYIQIKDLFLKEDELLFQDLITDSKRFLIEQNIEKYSFDFYLENFLIIYHKKEIKELLKCFDLKKIELSKNLNPKRYAEVLNECENDPLIIMKYSNKKKDKYYYKFYALLLFFKMNYDKDSFYNILKKEELWKYFIDIIFENLQIFRESNIPNEFIIELIKRKYSSPSDIEKIFNLVHSTESLFIILRNTLPELSKTFSKEKINIIELVSQQRNDNLEIIFEEIKKIYASSSNENKFILINDLFFQGYININNQKNIIDLKNLMIINDMITFYQTIDDSFKFKNIRILLNKIHLTGLDLIKNNILKNDDLLNFIDNDEYFKDNTSYDNEDIKPLYVLNGFELESIDESFFTKWKKSNILKAYKFIFKSKFEKALIYKAKNFTDIVKIYKLLDYDNNNYYDEQSFQYFIGIYMIIVDSNENKDKNFMANDISFIFNLLNKINFNEKEKSLEFYKNVITNIIEAIIEINFPNIQIIKNIYDELTTKYDNIKKEITDLIHNYLIENSKNGILKGKEIFALYKNLKLIKTKAFILSYLDNFLITKEKLFSNKNEQSSLELFNAIQDSEIITAVPEILSTNYYKKIYDFRLEISNLIKYGKIEYNLINWINKENIKILNTKLFFLSSNLKIYKALINNFNNFFNKISEHINDFDMLLKKIKNYKESIFDSEVERIKNIRTGLNDKLLCDIDIKYLKEEYLKINDIIDKKINLMNSSFIFSGLYNLKKKLNLIKNDETIYNEAKKEFIKLKSIFEKRIDEIEENILGLFFESLYKLNDNEILKELIFMKNFFEINIEDNYLNELKDKIIILFTKQKIFQNINECLLFVFDIEKNNNNYLKDFKESLIKIDSLLDSNNIKDILDKKNNELEDKNTKGNEQKDNEIKGKYEDINLSIDFIKYHRLLISNEKLKDLKIRELENKLSIYPFKLKTENEKIINVNIKTFDERIFFSFYCKNTDIFSIYESKFYGLYPQFIITDNIFKINDNIIDKNKSFEDNKIYDGNIIILFYTN